MSILSAWLRSLVGTTIILGFLELVLPEGELHRFARVVMGLLVVLVLLQPLVGIIGQDPSLDRMLAATAEPARQEAVRPDQAAARISAAGLSALEAARRDELERSLASFCADRAGTPGAQVWVSTGPDGEPRVMIRVPSESEAARLKTMVVSHYSLPEAAVEVISGG